MKLNQFLFVGRSMRIFLVFALSLSVFFSCSDGINEIYEKEEEGFEEGEVLKGFDLWTEMRAYPNKEIKAPTFSRAFVQGQQMSIQARSEALNMDLPNTAPWSELAPLNFSGRILCVAFHPTDPNIMFVGSASGGLWKTTTNGNDWTSSTQDLPSLGVSSILIDHSNPSVMYIGTGDRDAGDASGVGVYRSTDGGSSWEPWNAGISNHTVGRLLMHPSNHLIIFAATNGYFDDVPVNKVAMVENKLIEYIKAHKMDIDEKLSTGNKIDEALSQELKKTIEEFKNTLLLEEEKESSV